MVDSLGSLRNFKGFPGTTPLFLVPINSKWISFCIDRIASFEGAPCSISSDSDDDDDDEDNNDDHDDEHDVARNHDPNGNLHPVGKIDADKFKDDNDQFSN